MKKDHAGVYIPPPLIFVAIFVIGYLIQKAFPINNLFFENDILKMLGILLFLIALFLLYKGIWKFIATGTTLVTMKPTSSLQITGIYRFTRNPMYLGMVFSYLAITCFFGNWWHIILLPFLILIIETYVIKREEKYLERKFGQSYLDYRNKVRRWF
jgi:protein-S-isoprenylcysteine O-methyltransferase Ste14